MLLLKGSIVFIACLLLASYSIFRISDTNQKKSIENQLASNQFDLTQSLPEQSSGNFIHYQRLIQNSPIDKEKIQSDINSLDSKFEREYLIALLNKRVGKFSEAFENLFLLLVDFPDQLNFYEDLSSLAKISGKLDKLSEWLTKNKTKADNFYYLYLDALVENQYGKTSAAIAKFEALIEKGFKSREIYFELASAYRAVGNYDSSLKILNFSESYCDSADYYYPKILNLKGTIYFLSGEYEEAKKYYKYALEKSEKNENRVELIKATANLAIIKDQYGEIYEAREDFQQSIKLADEIENIELLAFLHSELGVSFTYTQNLIEARKNYEKSFSLYDQLKNKERLSYLSSNIGSLYLQIANYKSALDFYSRGLEFAGENKLAQILNLTGLGDVYSNESNYSKAIEYYNRAKEIADSIKDISSLIKIDQGIGALYYNINLPIDALEILKNLDSETLGNELPFESIKLYSKLGTILTSIDNLPEAEKYFQKGIDLAMQFGDIYSSISLRIELANNYILQENYYSASKLLTEVNPDLNTYELTQLMGLKELYWGKIYSAQSKKELSVQKFKNAFQLSGSVHDFNNQIEAAYLLGKYFEEINDFSNAEKWYLASIDLIENISSPLSPNQEIQIAHFAGLNSVYNSLTNLYLNQGKNEEAFMIIDKSRSRNTKYNLNKLKILSLLKDENQYNKLIDIEWMISSGLYDEVTSDSLTKVLANIKKELISNSNNLEDLINRKEAFTLTELKENIDDNDFILTVYVDNNSITLFNLSQNKLNYKTIRINRDSLLSMINRISPIFRSNMQNEEIYVNEDLFSFNAQAAYKLYENLFKDFLADVPKGSNLIINFPQELMKLPIEILVTEWTEGESPYFYNDKNFLLEDYKISYTPSASIYKIQSVKTETNQTQNLLIGDPSISNLEYSLSVRSGLVDLNSKLSRNILLTPLEYSKDEIESIDDLVSNNKIFLSQDATESNFKQYAPSSNVIHVSSHSFLLKDQPLIIFSQQKNDQNDGYLELGEIVQLNLSSDLVVLSSCRSGLGKIDASEGILGMQKAFFDAGAKSIIVSLWDVNDKYTSYFMKDFYKHLASGISKSEALRKAKLDFIKNYSSNPYYWSAFVLSGNPSSINIQEASFFTFFHFLGILLLIGLIYFIFKKYFPIQS